VCPLARKLTPIVLCALLAAVVACGAGCVGLRQSRQSGSGAEVLHITSGGIDRTYTLHVPPSYKVSSPVPLLLAYHGHGGDGAGQARLSGMDATSDANGFIVAYPDGVNHAWNDGRTGQAGADIDDVGFTSDLITRLEKDYRIDKSRVYATGMSNGGMLCYRLAVEIPDKIAAIAPVAALMSQDLAGRGVPSTPVAVMITAGTDDPLMPYVGGSVGLFLKMRGDVLSAADTTSLWVKADGCSATPVTTQLPYAVPSDGTRVTVNTYGGGKRGTDVLLYTVDGGGHAWPGGQQYLSSRIIGRTSRDYSASKAIWDFFKGHSLTP